MEGAHAASSDETATAMSGSEVAAYKGLLQNALRQSWPIGGLRLKRDISEYGDFVRSFNAATVYEKFESFSIKLVETV
nr:exocyst complex component SEC10B-like isoform X2 [Tanacetum cinerariifolium]